MTVYLINAAGTDHYKIGLTRNQVGARLAALQTGCPHRLQIVAEFTWMGAEDEAALHEEYGDNRVHGEWFRMDRHTVNAIVLRAYSEAAWHALVKDGPCYFFEGKAPGDVRFDNREADRLITEGHIASRRAFDLAAVNDEAVEAATAGVAR